MLAKKKLRYFDAQRRSSYLPHVIETSAGSDRVLLMLLCEGLMREDDGASPSRVYLKLPAPLAPVQAAILPLVKKDGLAARAQQLVEALQYDFSVRCEVAGSIGKRYARQDLIGTPYCLTLDYQTLQDDTVTLRERDTMQQRRLPMQQVADYLRQHTSMALLLKKLAPPLAG